MLIELTSLLTKLIAFPSITPQDAGCQGFIADELEELGFSVTSLPCNHVSNLWATVNGDHPDLIFAGHTDVVPVGHEYEWTTPPFTADIRHEHVYGRGTADMKSAIAAFILAVKTALIQKPNLCVGILLTSGEEGDDYLDGTPVVMQYLEKNGIKPKFCIVGEPSSHKKTGDSMRIGRRGSLNGKLKIIGKQGHVAYSELADNPIHRALPALAELAAIQWDSGNEFFPATQLQISNLHSGTGASNVIPGILECIFNFRYSPEVTHEKLEQTVEALLKKHQLNYEVQWKLSGKPFLTRPDAFIESLQSIITRQCGQPAELNTGGGTSDARFIAPHSIDVVELGVCNATIHQVDECVSLSDLENLYEIYVQILLTLKT